MPQNGLCVRPDDHMQPLLQTSSDVEFVGFPLWSVSVLTWQFPSVVISLEPGVLFWPNCKVIWLGNAKMSQIYNFLSKVILASIFTLNVWTIGIQSLTRNPSIEVRLSNWLHFISNLLRNFQNSDQNLMLCITVIMELLMQACLHKSVIKKYFSFFSAETYVVGTRKNC